MNNFTKILILVVVFMFAIVIFSMLRATDTGNFFTHLLLFTSFFVIYSKLFEKKRMKKINSVTLSVLLMVFIVVWMPTNLHSKFIQTAKVKYAKNYSWSEYYTVEVTFMTGLELNKATNSYDYESYSVYGIIFWDQGEASVIEISTALSCLNTAEARCIRNNDVNLEGEDQEGRNWEICENTYCN